MRYHIPCGAGLRRTLFALVVVAACEDGTAPTASPVEPRYGLLRIDSLVLPVLAFVSGPDTTFLATEVVTLREDHIAAFVREYRTVGVGVPSRTGRMEFSLAYVRSNGTITMDDGLMCFTTPCPRNALAGPITDSTMQLVQSDAPSRVFRYGRLSVGSAVP